MRSCSLLLVATLPLMGACGLIDAATSPEGESCNDTLECGGPDTNELICDSTDFTCRRLDETGPIDCPDAADELDTFPGGTELVIFDPEVDWTQTSPPVIPDVTQLCVNVDLYAYDAFDSLPADLNDSDDTYLDVQTDIGDHRRPDNREFLASSQPDEVGYFFINFTDCWLSGAGVGELPDEVAVQLIRQGIPSNVLCVSP